MHRNGVKILGTFIVESEKIHSERMLVQKDGEFIVAKRLAAIANAYGFDGWLLNVEIDFPKVVDDGPEKLAAFIRNLKRLLGPEGLVIWYDALTSDNKVDYQNGLTEKNAPFALAADSLFTNYKWTKAKLEQAKIISQWHGILPKEVLFGIDVWAQCTDMPGPPRVTFPAKGGGGTNTGLVSLHLLAPFQLSPMAVVTKKTVGFGHPRREWFFGGHIWTWLDTRALLHLFRWKPINS